MALNKTWKERRESYWSKASLEFSKFSENSYNDDRKIFSVGFDAGYQEALKDMGPLTNALQELVSQHMRNDGCKSESFGPLLLIAKSALALFEKLKAETKE
jgi:hypothetical protein